MLAEQGIIPTFTYVADILGNSLGGMRRDVRYASDFSVDLQLDLATLWGLPGMRFHVSASWRAGQDLSARDIGNAFTVAQIFGGESVRLSALSLQQSFANEQLNILLGRLEAGDEFLTSPLYTTFVSTAFNGNPISVAINIPVFSTYPVATWGIRVRGKPIETVYVMGGVYYSDPTLGQDNAHGADFGIRRAAGAFKYSTRSLLA